MYQLGKTSLQRLDGVHPNLVRVVRRAIEITAQDFSVNEGLRTLERQRRLVASGASQTLNSKHLKQADGFGHAVDLVPRGAILTATAHRKLAGIGGIFTPSPKPCEPPLRNWACACAGAAAGDV